MTVDDRNERLFNAIETALTHLHKKDSPAEQMNELRSRYDAAMYVLESGEYMLQEAGLSKADALLFSAVPAIARRCSREAFGDKPRLNTVSQMAEYLQGFFIGIHVEHFYLVCLDKNGRHIDTVLLQRGGDDSAPFYLGQMLSTAVSRGAGAVVLCHNHPRGTLRPSDEDIRCTLDAMNALVSTDIILLDHIIIAGDCQVSIRESGLVLSHLWLKQDMKSSLNRNWLDKELLTEERAMERRRSTEGEQI
jgi:DNA repair protein RadC